MDKLLEMEMSLELKALRNENKKLKDELALLKEVIAENDLEEEVGIEKIISPEEEVCVKGINDILERVRSSTHDPNDIKSYDLLHKNLRLIRNQAIEDTKKKKQKPANIDDLLRIVDDKKS